MSLIFWQMMVCVWVCVRDHKRSKRRKEREILRKGERKGERKTIVNTFNTWQNSRSIHNVNLLSPSFRLFTPFIQYNKFNYYPTAQTGINELCLNSSNWQCEQSIYSTFSILHWILPPQKKINTFFPVKIVTE